MHPGAPRRWVTAAALTLAFHGTLLFGTDWLDQFRRSRATAEQEIPVEVVEEPQPEQPKPPEQQVAQEAPAQPEPQQPPPPAPPEPPPQPAPEPTPPVPQQPPVSRGDVSGAPSPKPDEPAAQQPQASSVEVPPPPSAEALPEETKKPVPLPSEQAVATAEFFMSPPTFRSAALPGATRESEDTYKSLIFGMLDRAQRTPAGAQARGARGSAFVTFIIDRAGNLVSVSLLRSTGDRELDAEAIALVRRAAPFPTPPLGALLTFTPRISFGEGG